MAAMKAQERARMRNRFRNLRPGATNMKSLPPVDVVVRCGRTWKWGCLSPPEISQQLQPSLAVLMCIAVKVQWQEYFCCFDAGTDLVGHCVATKLTSSSFSATQLVACQEQV